MLKEYEKQVVCGVLNCDVAAKRSKIFWDLKQISLTYFIAYILHQHHYLLPIIIYYTQKISLFPDYFQWNSFEICIYFFILKCLAFHNFCCCCVGFCEILNLFLQYIYVPYSHISIIRLQYRYFVVVFVYLWFKFKILHFWCLFVRITKYINESIVNWSTSHVAQSYITF